MGGAGPSGTTDTAHRILLEQLLRSERAEARNALMRNRTLRLQGDEGARFEHLAEIGRLVVHVAEGRLQEQKALRKGLFAEPASSSSSSESSDYFEIVSSTVNEPPPGGTVHQCEPYGGRSMTKDPKPNGTSGATSSITDRGFHPGSFRRRESRKKSDSGEVCGLEEADPNHGKT